MSCWFGFYEWMLVAYLARRFTAGFEESILTILGDQWRLYGSSYSGFLLSKSLGNKDLGIISTLSIFNKQLENCKKINCRESPKK